jgi:hypothetical protein
MAETIADVLVRLGVDTEGLRSGFREARSQTARFASELARILSGQGGPLGIAGGITQLVGERIPGRAGGILSTIGGFISSIGSALSGLFRKAARDVARLVKRTFDEIILAYREGSASLGQTIEQLEAERAEAIRRLSKKKGGRDELRKLLPQFDQALASLRSQQQSIFERFDEQLDLLRTGEAFRGVAADVRDVVRQFRAYVDAGGDLARANEFLSRSLEQIRGDSATALAEGEVRAIEGALRLNDLLREREALLADAAEEERRIRSRGVLERQLTLGQQRARELEALRQQRDERLAALDQEIRLQQLKVDAEAGVFDLARDRIALETRLLELKAAEFNREAAQLKALRDIVAGIVPTAAGLLTLTPAVGTELNLGTVQIFLGENATPQQARAAGEEVIESMLRAAARERERLGLLTA